MSAEERERHTGREKEGKRAGNRIGRETDEEDDSTNRLAAEQRSDQRLNRGCYGTRSDETMCAHDVGDVDKKKTNAKTNQMRPQTVTTRFVISLANKTDERVHDNGHRENIPHVIEIMKIMPCELIAVRISCE